MHVPAGITASHLARVAIVSIRQSSEKQVQENTASPLYQRGQKTYAINYGWKSSQVKIIEDLGRSASTIGNREGFERILSQISQRQIGAIFCHDLSRLSRNALEFQILLVNCKIFDVLIFDDGRLLDPKDATDAFMASMRADVAQLENMDRTKKMQDGRRARVKAGFAVTRPPIGYVSHEKGLWAKHHNEDVQRVLELIFKQAQRLPSIYAVWKFLRERDVLVPVQESQKMSDHRVRWKKPTMKYVNALLVDPNYTQDYHFQKEVSDMRCGYRERGPHKGRPKQRKAEPDEIIVAWDHHEAYIDRSDFEKFQEKFRKNVVGRFQPAREGKNILQGIVFCGHCGRRMASNYSSNKRGTSYYHCSNTEDPCVIRSRVVRAGWVDAEVQELLSKVVTGPAVEKVIMQYEAERQQAFLAKNEHERRIRRAEEEALMAERAYLAVNPENHMVKEKLEVAWQQSLQRVNEVKNGTDKRPEPPPPISEEQKERLRYFCENFQETIEHPDIEILTKKRLARCFIKKVVLGL